MTTNNNTQNDNKFDAIVIGSGMSGGIAAKELSQSGLKTLVLERGRDVKHIKDYPTMNKAPWELPYADQLTARERKHYDKQLRTGYTVKQSTKHWWVKDTDQPYHEVKGKFDWIRGYHVGGKSLLWGRHVYRWSDLDFEANLKEGIGIDWPIRYKDIEKWYDYIETYIGICGRKEGLPQLPDGKFLPPFELNCVEKDFRENLKEKYNDRILTSGRLANITANENNFNGRGKCQSRNLCIRGCPFGGYYSSNSGSLPDAMNSGNMTLRPYSIVHSIIYDEKKNNEIDKDIKKKYFSYKKILTINFDYIVISPGINIKKCKLSKFLKKNLLILSYYFLL